MVDAGACLFSRYHGNNPLRKRDADSSSDTKKPLNRVAFFGLRVVYQSSSLSPTCVRLGSLLTTNWWERCNRPRSSSAPSG